MPLVFVYGTLMRGGCRAGALAAEQFVDVAKTEPLYRLYDCGSYPGLVESDDGVPVEGELWRASDACLLRLDEVEGVSEGLYDRQEVQLAAPAVDEPVAAYFYRRDVTELTDIGSRWVNR